MVVIFEETVNNPELWESPTFAQLAQLFKPLERAFTEHRDVEIDGNTTSICMPNFWEDESWDQVYTRWSSLPHQVRQFAQFMRVRGDERNRH